MNCFISSLSLFCSTGTLQQKIRWLCKFLLLPCGRWWWWCIFPVVTGRLILSPGGSLLGLIVFPPRLVPDSRVPPLHLDFGSYLYHWRLDVSVLTPAFSCRLLACTPTCFSCSKYFKWQKRWKIGEVDTMSMKRVTHVELHEVDGTKVYFLTFLQSAVFVRTQVGSVVC